MLFRPGRIVCTRGVEDRRCGDFGFFAFVEESLGRHLIGDWGGAPATVHKHCQMWHWITTEIQLPICLT